MKGMGWFHYLVIVLAVVSFSLPFSFGQDKRDFDAKRAYEHVKNLVALGPRPVGSPSLEKARAYLVDSLRRQGIKTHQERFLTQTPLGPVAMENILGVIPGKNDEIIIIGSHYETKYFKEFVFLGANDGGSSTGLLLELGRVLAGKPRQYTIWLAFFDGEEALVSWSETDSLYGSRKMVENLKRHGQLNKVRAMILLDMVGDKELTIERVNPATPWLTDIIWKTAQQLGHGQVFLNGRIDLEDDHTPFLRTGVPATSIIDFRYGGNELGGKFWHTPEDTLDKISARSLGIVGQVVLASLKEIEAELNRRPTKR